MLSGVSFPVWNQRFCLSCWFDTKHEEREGDMKIMVQQSRNQNEVLNVLTVTP
jgi:hypothetical protein